MVIFTQELDMLRPRIIPALLVKDKGLVKTTRFKNPKYVGDPINAVKIFNEKESDELIVLDIDATTERREPDYKMIKNIATECRMPFCYGGGIKTVKQAVKILALGVEKIALSSAAIENTKLIEELAEQIGTQSVVVVLDVKKRFLDGKYEVYTNNAKKNTRLCPIEFAEMAEQYGAGELVINSIDNDGVMKGYDLKLINKIHSKINIPLTALGGAGHLSDISSLISNEGIIGAAAGSLFVFKGKYRAVLISYPSASEKGKLLGSSFQEKYTEK